MNKIAIDKKAGLAGITINGWTIYKPESFSFLFIAGKYDKKEGLTKQHILRIEQVEYQKPEGEAK